MKQFDDVDAIEAGLLFLWYIGLTIFWILVAFILFYYATMLVDTVGFWVSPLSAPMPPSIQ